MEMTNLGLKCVVVNREVSAQGGYTVPDMV
jgi:hypothetical protein